MKRTSFQGMNCSIAQSLDVVGEWWSLLIVRDVFNGIRRFEPLRTHLGVSKNVLSDRLKHLVDQEILHREPRFCVLGQGRNRCIA